MECDCMDIAMGSRYSAWLCICIITFSCACRVHLCWQSVECGVHAPLECGICAVLCFEFYLCVYDSTDTDEDWCDIVQIEDEFAL